MRHCRITNCTKPARPGRRICDLHRTRIVRHRDPHFTTWTAADDHDVQALIREQRPTSGLTRLERIQVAQGLTSLGLPATEIARILGVTERTVYRWRTEGFRQTTPARPAQSASNVPGALQGPRGSLRPAPTPLRPTQGPPQTITTARRSNPMTAQKTMSVAKLFRLFTPTEQTVDPRHNWDAEAA